eukprot:CCRYP_013964-RA/>CCRYP_013964-RA protein AED:0.40 eAED:0.40 QI:0/0/0/1/0/0/2/0/137
MQDWEGFTFATALDLNMGYYTIRLDPDASKICTIIFPWVLLPQVTNWHCWFSGHFSIKMMELMATLEFIRAYIDDLLCTTKGTLEDHLAKLELVLSRLQDVNLNVNTCKPNFCAIETDYLGYILSQDGIKPQPNKVK